MNKHEPTLEQKVQRALDIREVENVMSRHAYYHALGQNAEELDAIWVKTTPEPKFSQNQGSYIGYDSIRRYYGEINVEMRRMNLAALRKHYPTLADSPANLGAGTLIMHPLTTSIIEVAGDGQTAKGMWYSPGQVTEVFPPDFKPVAHWIWERYGVDFVKENGAWKIWHMLVCTDFFTPVGMSWVEMSAPAPMGAGGPPIAMPQPDAPSDLYQTYSPIRVAPNFPRMPEPYEIFSETFSY